MKNIIVTTILIWASLISVLAQTEGYWTPIEVEAFYIEESVRLRWAVVDRESWYLGNEYGYTITRHTKAINGVDLTSSEVFNSRVILAENYKPMKADEIDLKLPDNQFAQNAKNLLYTEEIENDKLPEDQITLATAFQASERRNAQFLFTQMTADMDFDASCALGLGFIDSSIETNNEYVYSVEFSKYPSSETNEIGFNSFESGLGGWIDGGNRINRQRIPYPYSGYYTLELRHNLNSFSTTDNLDFTEYTHVQLDFTYWHHSIEGSESFNLEVSYDGGETFNIVREFSAGSDFSGNGRKVVSEIIELQDKNNVTQFRLRSFADQGADYFMFDDIGISASSNGIDFGVINFNDFETNWGIWNDGGSYVRRRYDPMATDGDFTIRFFNNSQYFTSPTYDLSPYRIAEISFNAYSQNLDDGEGIVLEYSLDNGVNYELHSFFDKTVLLDRKSVNVYTRISNTLLTSQVKFRIKLNSNSNSERVFIDEFKLDAASDVLLSNSTVATDVQAELDPIVITDVSGEQDVMNIEWEVNGNIDLYTYFDIERSTNQEQWTKINELPYIYAAPEGATFDRVSYEDMDIEPGQTYFYRVCGKTPYGILSSPSEPVSGITKLPALDLEIFIDDIVYYEVNDNVKLIWSYSDGIPTGMLQGFNIYKSENFSGPYTKINNEILNNTTSDFLDINPYATSYYRLEVVDELGYTYNSLTDMYQLEDAIPPAVPSNLTAKFINESQMAVSWDPVPDSDLNGYRIFTSNFADTDFQQVHEGLVAGTKLLVSIDQRTAVEKVFIKVASEDHRQNLSDKSDYIAVERPDIHPPSSPTISAVNATPDGIALTFVFSSSPDIEKHVLQRRATGGPTWSDILIIPKDEELDYPSDGPDPSFIDDMYDEPEEFEYRLIAHDEAFNVSGSQPYTVFPYVKRNDGHVSNLTIETEQTSKIRDPRLDREIQKLKEKGFDYQLNAKSVTYDHTINLSWEYELGPNLSTFEIYRAMTGSTMKLYKTITVGNAMGLDDSKIEVNKTEAKRIFTFQDHEVIPNRNYTYEIKAVNRDGTGSYRSNKVSKLIPVN